MEEFMDLFSEKDHYGSTFKLTTADVTEKAIRNTESVIGRTLPPSYLAFIKKRNGGMIKPEVESWVNTIYGISEGSEYGYCLTNLWENLIEEWEYPADVGFPFADTQSGAHDAYFFDYRRIEDGEPAIIRIDNELDNKEYYVAKNFNEFLSLIRTDKDMQGTRM